MKFELIRKEIKESKLHGYIILTSDEFLSEYPTARTKRLEYLTGFSCSNGILIVTLNRAIFFTDARYLDAANEFFASSEVIVENYAKIKKFDYSKYISQDDKIGFDPRFFTKNLHSYFPSLQLIACNDLVDKIWDSKPASSPKPVFEYDIKYAGKTRSEKIADLREYLKKENSDAIILQSPESISWLLNIRSFDSEFSPIVLAYLYLDQKKIIIFLDKRELPENFANEIEVRSFEEFEKFASKITSRLFIPSDSSIYIDHIAKNCVKSTGDDPCLIARSIKHDAEVRGAITAHIEDAIAVIEFLAWFEQDGGSKTEFALGEKITGFRKKSSLYLMDSFPPIVGFCENGAKIHYRADKDSAKEISGNGLLLIDSGGHYFGGTTDITRTIVVGKPQEEWKNFYTRVLKGHIGLSKIRFPNGLTGSHIDILARKDLWAIGQDYAHGTGHGVGNMLSVHEGPAHISLYNNQYHLKPGMILSNEPGYYKSSAFGIRIENLQYVREIGAYPGFYEFSPLTLVPYCKALISWDLINSDERAYLESYYENISNSLSDKLSTRALRYLNQEMI